MFILYTVSEITCTSYKHDEMSFILRLVFLLDLFHKSNDSN